MTLDRAALLAFLDQRADTHSPVVGAIYEALATRIRRGDFDETPHHTETKDPTHGQ